MFILDKGNLEILVFFSVMFFGVGALLDISYYFVILSGYFSFWLNGKRWWVIRVIVFIVVGVGES